MVLSGPLISTYIQICDREVVGGTFAMSGNFLSWRLIMKYFLVMLPSTDSKREVVSFWQKNMHKYWLTT